MSWVEIKKALNSNIKVPLDALIMAEKEGFGTGADCEVVFNTQDYSPKHIWNTTYFELPEGEALSPNSGTLTIYSYTDIIINGKIDMSEKATTVTTHSIRVRGVNYPVAKRGNTPIVDVKSGNGGNMTVTKNGSSIFNKFGSGIMKNNSGYYEVEGGSLYKAYISRKELKTYEIKSNSSFSIPGAKPVHKINKTGGVVILIARGKIVINGTIISRGATGENPTEGEDALTESSIYIYSGAGGCAMLPPAGGGSVTLIARNIDYSNGTINLNGTSFRCTLAKAPNGNSATMNDYTYGSDGNTVADRYQFVASGGEGGTGILGTHVSQAGEIKEYIYK